MKKLALLTLSALLAMCLNAQNIKVLKFEKLEKDMTANTHGTQKLDQNGEKAALIKIQAPEGGFTFDGGSLGIVASEDHDGEKDQRQAAIRAPEALAFGGVHPQRGGQHQVNGRE